MPALAEKSEVPIHPAENPGLTNLAEKRVEKVGFKPRPYPSNINDPLVSIIVEASFDYEHFLGNYRTEEFNQLREENRQRATEELDKIKKLDPSFAEALQNYFEDYPKSPASPSAVIFQRAAA